MTDLPADDQTFLKDLVKTSRRKHHHVKWTDRDGTARLTPVTSAEATRLNALANERRQAARCGQIPWATPLSGRLRAQGIS